MYDIDCLHNNNNDENLTDPQFHQGDKLGVWLADAREEEGVRCHNLFVFVSLLSQFVCSCFLVVTISICLFVSLLSQSQFVCLFLFCQNHNLLVCFFVVTITVYLQRHKDKDTTVVTIII